MHGARVDRQAVDHVSGAAGVAGAAAARAHAALCAACLLPAPCARLAAASSASPASTRPCCRRPALLPPFPFPPASFMKLRLDRVMKLDLAGMPEPEVLAAGEELPEFKKPGKWTAPYPMYAPNWWRVFYPGAN